MRGNCTVKRAIAILAVIAFLIFLFCGNMYHVSGLLYLQDMCESEMIVAVEQQKLEILEYDSFDDVSGDSGGGLFQLELKKKMHINIKNIIFMNIFFSMVLFPILAFIISIRLFGRCLARLWHVIVYIHKSDGGEIPLYQM